MPIYEYECGKCGHRDSDMESINAPRTKKCPKCGKRTFTRLISASAFHLKGGGWYATDFKDKPKDSSKGKDKEVKSEDKSETKGSEKSDKSDKKTDKKEVKSGKESSAKKNDKG